MSVFIRMWVLLVLMQFGLVGSAAANEILYCTDSERVGFAPEKQYGMSPYKEGRFTINFDLQNGKIFSEKLYLEAHNDVHCISDPLNENVMYCYGNLGSAFALNKKTLKYHYANVYIDDNPSDTIVLSHGQCEKF